MRELVTLLSDLEADEDVRVMVLESADPEVSDPAIGSHDPMTVAASPSDLDAELPLDIHVDKPRD